MNYYVPFAIICIFIAFLLRHNNRNSANVFTVTMIIAFVFAAIRYEFGPDWFNYYDSFQIISKYGVDGYFSNSDHSEPLFIRYFSLFPKYTLFLAVNSLFWFGSYYAYFRKYANAQYYWFVLLFLFFNTDCILNNLVAMRQALTSFLFIIAFIILDHNNYSNKGKAWFLFIIVVSAFLHTSCLVLIPLVLLNSKKNSLLFSKSYLITVVILSLSTIVLGRYVYTQTIAGFLLGNIEDFQRYEAYLSAFESTSLSGSALLRYIMLVFLNLIPVAFIIQEGRKEDNPTYIYIYKLGIVIATIGCLLGQGLMSRYMMILNPFYIVALVRSFSVSSNKSINTFVIVCVAFTSIYSFYHYLQADYCISFLTYHSVFSAPSIP